MTNYKMKIAYDGKRYNGWQSQGNTENTIQQKIEDTLKKLLEEDVCINGAGRTDAGVNALGQIANVHIKKFISCDELQLQLNQYLPKDIRIISVESVEPRFHARLNALGKHYSYRIDNGDVADVFQRKYVTRIEEKLDVVKMKKAAEYFVGEHDFASFCSLKKIKKSTIRTITSIEINEQNGMIHIELFGNGFLYNMVRIIAGTLIEIGLGQKEPEDVIKILKSRDRSNAGFLSQPQGLFLVEVFYKN